MKPVLPAHPRTEALDAPIKIVVQGVAKTWSSGGHYDWQRCVRKALDSHPARERLATWFRNGYLGIEVTFWLPSTRREPDIDNLLEPIFNPLLDGTFPELDTQPRRLLDGRFLSVLARKVITSGRPRAVILVYPVHKRTPKEPK